MKHFEAGQPNLADCERCGIKNVVFHHPSLDIAVPLNRSDMAFLVRTLTAVFCNRDISDVPQTENNHALAHRLIYELEQLNPTDKPFISTDAGPLNMFLSLFGAQLVIIEHHELEGE